MKPDSIKCEKTLDIEECIKMKSLQNQTKIKAEIKYPSGRVEIIMGDLKKDGQPTALFQKKIDNYAKHKSALHLDINIIRW